MNIQYFIYIYHIFLNSIKKKNIYVYFKFNKIENINSSSDIIAISKEKNFIYIAFCR